MKTYNNVQEIENVFVAGHLDHQFRQDRLYTNANTYYMANEVLATLEDTTEKDNAALNRLLISAYIGKEIKDDVDDFEITFKYETFIHGFDKALEMRPMKDHWNREAAKEALENAMVITDMSKDDKDGAMSQQEIDAILEGKIAMTPEKKAKCEAILAQPFDYTADSRAEKIMAELNPPPASKAEAVRRITEKQIADNAVDYELCQRMDTLAWKMSSDNYEFAISKIREYIRADHSAEPYTHEAFDISGERYAMLGEHKLAESLDTRIIVAKDGTTPASLERAIEHGINRLVKRRAEAKGVELMFLYDEKPEMEVTTPSGVVYAQDIDSETKFVPNTIIWNTRLEQIYPPEQKTR